MSQLTHADAVLIAKFIHGVVRPDWDEAGIVRALGAARGKGDAGTVAVAAIRAAQDRANRTPGVIPLTGPHWAAGGALPARRDVPPRNKTCATCYLGYDECRRRWHWDHDFESLDQARVRKIREADGVPSYVRHRANHPPQVMDGRPIKDVELPHDVG